MLKAGTLLLPGRMHQSDKLPLLLAITVIVLLGLVSWMVQARIASQVRLETGESLRTVLYTSHQAVRSWLKESQASIRIWADTPDVRLAARQLLDTPRDAGALLASPSQQLLRRWFEPLRKVSGYQGYFIIDPRNLNLASSRDVNVGDESLLAGQSKFLEKLWAGKAAVSLPQSSDVPLPDPNGVLRPGLPTMFLGAPILDESGMVIALLTFRVNPLGDFSEILQHARIGTSGETYAFDVNGLMISESRHTGQARAIGLLATDQIAMLNLELRDPGVDLGRGEKPFRSRDHWPLTYMAEDAVLGNYGTNLHGYRDYRGVPVIGVWLWDAELDFGIATELDVGEAFGTLRITSYTILGFTGLLALLVLAITGINSLRNRGRRAEQRIRALLESGPDPVLVADRAGKITFVNAQMENLFGYSCAEMIGQDMELLMPERFRNRHLQHLVDYFKAPALRPMGDGLELWGRHRDGREIPVEISLSPFESDQGTLVVGAIRDITHRKQIEDELNQYRDQLERLVTSRTAELEASNRDLESYSYSLAHDLRTPLRAITSFSQILEQDLGETLSPADRANLDRIIQAGKKMARLIDDIRELSRISRSEMNYVPVNLGELGKSIMSGLVRENPGRDLNWDIPDDLVVIGDPDLLEILLRNLLENAWKFTRQNRQSRIEVGSRCIGGEQVYYVEDNGSGFDMAYRDKLFKPFNRLHPDDDSGGTGIGLAKVLRIVQRHGGKIWVEAEKDHGATFRFTLSNQENRGR